MTISVTRGDKRFQLSDERERIDVVQVHAFLSERSYWGRDRSIDTVRRSIENSYCVACYESSGSLAGFARVVTDWSTMYYICDLFVLEEYRGQGLGKELVRAITTNAELRPLSGMLLTADAHGLYRQFGFLQNEQTGARFMRRPRETAT